MSTPWSWSGGGRRQVDEVRWSWKVTEMGQGHRQRGKEARKARREVIPWHSLNMVLDWIYRQCYWLLPDSKHTRPLLQHPPHLNGGNLDVVWSLAVCLTTCMPWCHSSSVGEHPVFWESISRSTVHERLCIQVRHILYCWIFHYWHAKDDPLWFPGIDWMLVVPTRVEAFKHKLAPCW